MSISSDRNLSFAENQKSRFILVYGLIGFISTILLLVFAAIGNPATDVAFFYAVAVAIPTLGFTAFFAFKKNIPVASYLALFSLLQGCFGSLTLEFGPFLSLLMVFVLSAIFITINQLQIILAYASLGLTIVTKILIETNTLTVQSMPSSNMNDESMVYISLFMLSVFIYAYIVNSFLNRGLKSSEELRETSYQLEETLKVKDRLVALISHDLRGPIGNMSLLLKGFREKKIPISEEAIGVLAQTTESSNELIENLLQWSSIQQDESMIRQELFSVRDCVEDCINLLQIMAKNKHIGVNNDCDQKATGFADRSMIATAIRNLLVNAIKYSDDNGQIRIWTESEKESVTVKIEDHGIGLSPGLLENLFVENKHESKRGTSNEKGSGLGLMITKDFINLNNGQIGAESVEGEGSLFWFTIPMKVPN